MTDNIYVKANQAYTDKDYKHPLLCETHNTPMIVDETIDTDPICPVCNDDELKVDRDTEDDGELFDERDEEEL